jgi:anti-sigma B factor antagonist
MHMMQARGLRWHERRLGGRLEIGLELPLDIDLRPTTGFELGGPAEAAKPAGPAPGADAPSRGVLARWVGRVDESTWEVFSNALIQAVREAKARSAILLLDLQGLQYMSSRGLRALTLARREAGSEVDIVLCRPNDRMREILQISRYDKMFKVVDSIDPGLVIVSSYEYAG